MEEEEVFFHSSVLDTVSSLSTTCSPYILTLIMYCRFFFLTLYIFKAPETWVVACGWIYGSRIYSVAMGRSKGFFRQLAGWISELHQEV